MHREPSPEQIKGDKLYQSMGLSDEEYARIVEKLGRLPNYTETGLFSVLWSEHCSYKNSKPVLKKFPTQGERVLQGPGEGAGVVDIGGGKAVVYKIESHNHPSAVEPYHGAATGVGGILRDVLCNQVPVVFCRELYASVSLFICALFLALRAAGIDADLNTLLCFALGFAFRMLAIRLGWKLPTFSYQQRWD